MASDINEYESALQNLRRRRLELKQQREQSSKKADNVCDPTALRVVAEGNEITTVPYSLHLPDQPSVPVHSRYSDKNSSSHLDVDTSLLPKSRLATDSNSHHYRPTLSSSSSSDKFLSKMEAVSSLVPVSTSSIGAFGSPENTSSTQYSHEPEKFLHSQGMTKSESDVDPDHLMIKKEERQKQQMYQSISSDSSHIMDIPSYEQRFSHQKLEKTLSHTVDIKEPEQEISAYDEPENSDMLAVGTYHVQEGGKQQQTLVTSKVSHMHTCTWL